MTPTPITQIVYLRIPPDKNLKQDLSGYYGKLWSSALDVIEKSDGFQRVYWGRSLETPENVQIHTGMFHPFSFLTLLSSAFRTN
jgi:hypothetical protein